MVTAYITMKEPVPSKIALHFFFSGLIMCAIAVITAQLTGNSLSHTSWISVQILNCG